MKIAMVSEHASPLAAAGGVDAGGQNLHVAELAAALVRRGHEVTVYTRRDDPGPADRVLTAAGYAVEHVPAGPARPVPKDSLLPHMAAFGDYLARRWRADRPDVAHAHFWMSGIATLAAARATGVPAALTFHALGSVKRRHQREKDTSPLTRVRTERSLGIELDRIIATSTDEVRELRQLGVPRTSISVVPCGVDVEHFSPSGPCLPPDPRGRVLAIGRLVERKGFDVLIRAMASVPDASLLIAGGPVADELDGDPEARRLLSLAEDLGLGDRVRLLGQVSRCELPALIRSADVVAHTPWYEPFGLVALEAMACGRPVVAAGVGGLTDTVTDLETGLLVPPRDPEAVASALNKLLADEDLRASYGSAGATRVASTFSWDRIAEATERIYTELTEAPASSLTQRGAAHLDAIQDALGGLRQSAVRLELWGRALH
ncbi:MAG: hypothetical protein QOI35_3284, partial [Cryptosporangiaceae bacterium]|nr:hypothetical protein [Cryptosporangiaceae bacterium]